MLGEPLELLGNVVAERRLQLVATDRPARELVMQLYQPVPFDDGGALSDDCRCPVQVTLDGEPLHRVAIGGVDAMQALQLALQYAETLLALVERDEGGAIEWPGGGRYTPLAGDPPAS